MKRPSFPFSTKVLLRHLIGWLVFIIYEVSFIHLARPGEVDAPLWSGYILPYLINIGLFYFHAYVTTTMIRTPHLRQVLGFSGLVLAELGVYLLLMGLVNFRHFSPSFWQWNWLHSSSIKLVLQLWRGLYFLIFATAYRLIEENFKNERKLRLARHEALKSLHEKQQLELQLLRTENAFIKSQINPHLLFNTLNFIHSEVQLLSPVASDAIITLSDMMRYSLLEIHQDGKIPLEKELEQIHNLVKINQYRFNNQLCIKLFLQEGAHTVRIAPLLFIPLVENMFKYAELTDPGHPARVEVCVSDRQLQFRAWNRKRRTLSVHSSKLGISNIKKRLEMYYPAQHLLDIQENDDCFVVHLKINVES